MKSMNTTGATYTYDADGRRVVKTTGGTSTYYYYDISGKVIVEKNQASVWTTGYISLNGQMVAQYSDGTTYFAHKDHLGSMRVMTKLDKTVQDNMDYLPFGEQVSGGSSTRRKFTGHERDAESGLDYMGARYYTSLTGRFMSADLPFIDQNPGNPQSWNLYHYARNNPLAYTDPTGNASESSYCNLARCAPYEHNGGREAAPTTRIDVETTLESATDVGARILAYISGGGNPIVAALAIQIFNQVYGANQGTTGKNIAQAAARTYVADLKSPEIARLLDPNHKSSKADGSVPDPVEKWIAHLS